MFWGSFICLLVALILVNFSAGAVTFQLRAWTDRQQDWAQVRSDLSIAINDTLARAAGVKIYEYQGGLLHTKSLTLDGEVTLIGSANMDRRSFELNYENNILFHDPALTGAVRERQQEYISRSHPVTKEAVAAWPISRRLWNNLIATLGPVL